MAYSPDWFRNERDPRPALVISQEPGAAGIGNPALALNQADPAGAALVIRSAGAMLDLQDLAGNSKFKIDGAGNMVAAVAPQPVPADFGYVAWTSDPGGAGASGTISLGVLTLIEFFVRVPGQTISTIGCQVTSGGGTLTSGQNFAAIFDSAGAQKGITADQTTNWGSAAARAMALTSAFTNVPVGRYYVAFLTNGSTSPTFRFSAATPALANLNLATSTLRFATFSSGLTAVPASYAPASMVTTNASPVAAILY